MLIMTRRNAIDFAAMDRQQPVNRGGASGNRGRILEYAQLAGQPVHHRHVMRTWIGRVVFHEQGTDHTLTIKGPYLAQPRIGKTGMQGFNGLLCTDLVRGVGLFGCKWAPLH